MTLFHYLHYGLAFILVFIGSKLLAEASLRQRFNLELSRPVSLGIVGTRRAGAAGASLRWPNK